MGYTMKILNALRCQSTNACVQHAATTQNCWHGFALLTHNCNCETSLYIVVPVTCVNKYNNIGIEHERVLCTKLILTVRPFT